MNEMLDEKQFNISDFTDNQSRETIILSEQDILSNSIDEIEQLLEIDSYYKQNIKQ